MNSFNSSTALLTALLTFLCTEISAQHIMKEGSDEEEARRRTTIIPYAFSSETLGFGLGVGGTHGPRAAPQTTYFGMGYLTDNGSWLLMLGGSNVQLPVWERLSLRPYLSLARNSQMRIYIDGNPDYLGKELAGSNASSKENYIERDANEITFYLPIRYTLPMGHFRERGIHTYITRNGILKENPSGAESLNPFTSGQTILIARPYYRKTYDDTDEGETLYLELGLEHDNRDFVPNPHRGYKARIAYRYDPEWLDKAREWASWEGELDTFLPLPETSWVRQQTVALSAWAAYAPTYDVNDPTNAGRPPYFAGPSLGGLYRLRGYPAYRFHDKAAIHYTAEYRLMPEWQPFGDIEFLDPLMIRWWQLVALVEAGRVAPGWDISTLHQNMKYDYGFGIRGMFNTGVMRLDFVTSEEGTSFTVMFGHSF